MILGKRYMIKYHFNRVQAKNMKQLSCRVEVVHVNIFAFTLFDGAKNTCRLSIIPERVDFYVRGLLLQCIYTREVL